MSSILKALEKAEEAQSVRRDGGPGGFKKPRERRRPWIVPAAVLGGAAVAALATFAAMGGFSRSAAPVAAVDAVTAPAQHVAAPNQQIMVPVSENPAQPASADGVQQGADLQAANEAVPVPLPVPVPVSKPEMDAVAKRVTGGGGRVVRATPTRPAVASAAPAPAKAARQKAAPAPLRPEAPQPVAARKAAVQAEAAPAAVQTAFVAEAAPVRPEKARPEIRVTGIAWQKGSASNGAIVNGRMLEQGGVIDGYKVEQILEDRVVFSGSGGKLEVPLSAGQ